MADVLVALLFSIALGLLFAQLSIVRVRADGPFASPAFPLIASFAGIVIAPTALYFYWAHPAWSSLYLIDPQRVSGIALLPLLVAHAGALIGGWYLGARLIRVDKTKQVNYIAAGVGFVGLVLTIVFWGRLGRYGSLPEYRDGRALDLMEVKLGYVLICIALFVAAAAVAVALELRRDNRRATAA